MKLDIVRAWKDEAYRESLTQEQQALLPVNPVGEIEMSDAELAMVVGAGCSSDCYNPCNDPHNYSHGHSYKHHKSHRKHSCGGSYSHSKDNCYSSKKFYVGDSFSLGCN